jgi:membrane protein
MGKIDGKQESANRPVIVFLKEISGIWVAERPTQLAAALAYFGLFSFAPVIYLAFSIAGIFFDQAALMENFMTRLEDVLGPEVAATIQQMLDGVNQSTSDANFLISVLSFFALLLAASGVFYQLQFALNSVWKVTLSTQAAVIQTMRQRLFSFLMVIAVGLLLVAGAVLSVFINWLSSLALLFGFDPSFVVIGFFVVATLAFGVMYKLLPHVKLAWRDVWGGAVAAALLVTLGGWLIILFIQNTSLASALEATGSFIILLTGFYYFAQIFLLGAIITRIYAQRYGSMRPPPADTA